MIKNILPAIRLTLVCIAVFMFGYPLLIWGVAQFAPNKGKGLVITHNGKTYHSVVGQNFTEDKYFWSRPSAVGYNAAGSGGSNKGPSNPDYLAEVQGRIDSFLAHNPGVKKEDIPADLVTASGSGLDPDISVEGAKVQAQRIAKVRGLSQEAVSTLIDKQTEKPLLGIMGPEKVNVLKLNIQLDKLSGYK